LIEIDAELVIIDRALFATASRRGIGIFVRRISIRLTPGRRIGGLIIGRGWPRRIAVGWIVRKAIGWVVRIAV